MERQLGVDSTYLRQVGHTDLDGHCRGQHSRGTDVPRDNARLLRRPRSIRLRVQVRPVDVFQLGQPVSLRPGGAHCTTFGPWQDGPDAEPRTRSER